MGPMTPPADRLQWAGFAPLRQGRIHIFCPKCRRKLSNAERTELDPPQAELVHVWCEKCSSGCKSDLGSYFDGEGRRLMEVLDDNDNVTWEAR